MLAFSKAPHIKLGWLWKLARHRNTFGMRNWKKRYITLNTKSRVLSYYKSNVSNGYNFTINKIIQSRINTYSFKYTQNEIENMYGIKYYDFKL